MTCFSLTSKWNIPVPIEHCWFCLLDTNSWPDWWPYVANVEQIKAGDDIGVGNIYRYYWHTCLPYHLWVDIEVTELIPFQKIIYTATGDLQGHGACHFTQTGDTTVIHFDWHVATNKPWMNILAGIAHPVFIWNHQRVMKKGEQSLIQRLNSGP